MRKSAIGKAASELTKEQFSEEISKHCRLTSHEVSMLFPTKRDREELATMIDIVVNATDDNDRAKRLVDNATSVSGALVKVLKKFLVA
jgi:hypothetical protein